MPSCSIEGCSVKYAEWGYSKEDKVRRCKKHADEGMIPLNRDKLRCKAEGCNVTASKVPPGMKTPQFCAKHAPEGYKQVHGCRESDCMLYASFGHNDKKMYCLIHKKDGMTRGSGPSCTIEGCTKTGKFKTKEGNRACFFHSGLGHHCHDAG